MASRIIPNNRTMQQLARLVTTNLMIRRNFLELLVDNKPPNPPDPSLYQEQIILIQA